MYIASKVDIYITGFTIIGHDLPPNTSVHKCQGIGCYGVHLNYSATLEQLKALTDISASCHQTIKV